ncbi:MAG: redoxin family protein, partial [Hyphomicrobium sp.]
MTETTARNARSTLKLFPVFLFLAVAGLFAVALRTGDPSKLPSALIGKPVPQSTFPAIDSVPTAGFTSADLAKGQVTVVNFWASWCAPCVEEHPLLTELAKSGVTLFGVNYKDDPA